MERCELSTPAQIIGIGQSARVHGSTRADIKESERAAMRILIESVVVGLLGLPLTVPWIAIPFFLVRLLVGAAEETAQEIIVVAPPGDRGALAEALGCVALVAVPGGVLLLAMLAAAVIP